MDYNFKFNDQCWCVNSTIMENCTEELKSALNLTLGPEIFGLISFTITLISMAICVHQNKVIWILHETMMNVNCLFFAFNFLVSIT